MKALFIGGIKSGKSLHAEAFALKHSKLPPVYLATTEFIDEEMKERIDLHKLQRSENFLTLEEPMNLLEAVRPLKTLVLLECTSMWINNMLYHGFKDKDIKEHLEKLLCLPQDIVFVLNDVGAGVIPDNALAREYVDISGKSAQILGKNCDSVFHCIAGICTKIK